MRWWWHIVNTWVCRVTSMRITFVSTACTGKLPRFWFLKEYVLEFLEASMHNVPNLQIQGTYLPNSYLHCFHASFGVFYVYPLLFCSLQCMYKDMYCSYLSVCLWNFHRQPEILSLYLDHTNDFWVATHSPNWVSDRIANTLMCSSFLVNINNCMWWYHAMQHTCSTGLHLRIKRMEYIQYICTFFSNSFYTHVMNSVNSIGKLCYRKGCYIH